MGIGDRCRCRVSGDDAGGVAEQNNGREENDEAANELEGDQCPIRVEPGRSCDARCAATWEEGLPVWSGIRIAKGIPPPIREHGVDFLGLWWMPERADGERHWIGTIHVRRRRIAVVVPIRRLDDPIGADHFPREKRNDDEKEFPERSHSLVAAILGDEMCAVKPDDPNPGNGAHFPDGGNSRRHTGFGRLEMRLFADAA